MTRARFAVLGALVVAGCSGQLNTLNFPRPAATSPAPTTTIARDMTGVSLAGVGGQVSDKVTVGPGAATISGTVVGPSGPVAGGVVEVERLVGDAVGAVQVTAAPDGTWTLPQVLGGRYRVRAWRAPDLAQVTPEIFFLNQADTKSLTLMLRQFDAVNVSAAIAPNPPIINEPASLAVLVSNQVVSTGGVVSSQAVTGASVQLAAGGPWATADPNPATTGAGGTVTWLVVCTQPGAQPLAVVVNAVNTYSLNLPPCGVPPTTTIATSTTIAPATATTVK